MLRVRTAALVLVALGWACKDDGADDAGLFGDGMPNPTTLDDGDPPGSSTGTTGSEDDAPPPPPPPPATTTGEDDTTAGVDPGTDSSGGSTGIDDGSSSSSDDGDTFNDGTLDVQVVNQSMFMQGQCDDVFVTNISAMSVTWEVELPLPGTIDQVWNAEVVEMPGSGVFTGVAFNATIDPGAQAMFGYCVLY
ncbi:cellulose binding domain-containing protein [Paraliomyxa miuraensis]|uniref:cellulose binding domain-containing protein n=1 Tax=Paraliomyxa miuraensis TaxID=376150 RepID=UPI002258081E|nr:cellulose binding domain-containing protein [Paraliomyxa miuraensis]MCX4244856.1 cellulose binding domain-containing protein [Paraliomyxa miuraensis]